MVTIQGTLSKGRRSLKAYTTNQVQCVHKAWDSWWAFWRAVRNWVTWAHWSQRQQGPRLQVRGWRDDSSFGFAPLGRGVESILNIRSSTIGSPCASLLCRVVHHSCCGQTSCGSTWASRRAELLQARVRGGESTQRGCNA